MRRESTNFLIAKLEALYASWPEDTEQHYVDALMHSQQEDRLVRELRKRAREGDALAAVAVRQHQHPVLRENARDRRRQKEPLDFDDVHTRGMLAGAYIGRDRQLRTHLVYRREDVDVRVGCRQPLCNMADEYADTEEELRRRPTCPTCARKWDKLQVIRKNASRLFELPGRSDLVPNESLHRATSAEESEVHPWSCWTEDIDVAFAYTEEGVGHGGAHVRSIDADLSNTLDITARNKLGAFVELAEALGYDDPEWQVREWFDSGWLYPWEESSAVRRRLSGSGYDWLRYDDDYPEGVVTLMRIG